MKFYHPGIIFFIFPFSLASQIERGAITSTANYFSNSNIFYYDAGDLAVESLNGITGIYTQGFIQPSDKTLLSIKEQFNEEEFYHTNPVKDICIIKCKGIDVNVSIRMFDILGNQIQAEHAIFQHSNELKVTINLENIACGNYIIKLIDKQNVSKAIIKIAKI